MVALAPIGALLGARHYSVTSLLYGICPSPQRFPKGSHPLGVSGEESPPAVTMLTPDPRTTSPMRDIRVRLKTRGIREAFRLATVNSKP